MRKYVGGSYHIALKDTLEEVPSALGRYSQAKPNMVSLIGNWHRNSRDLRGHTTRNLKPYLSTLSTTSAVILADEYNSTQICCSCFQETQKQLVRHNDGSMKRNLGAVTCVNPACPKRLKRQATISHNAMILYWFFCMRK